MLVLTREPPSVFQTIAAAAAQWPALGTSLRSPSSAVSGEKLFSSLVRSSNSSALSLSTSVLFLVIALRSGIDIWLGAKRNHRDASDIKRTPACNTHERAGDSPRASCPPLYTRETINWQGQR